MKSQLAMFDEPSPQPVLTDYDWIVVSSSAGKDSLATLSTVCAMVRIEAKIGHRFRQELSMADVAKAVDAGEGGAVTTWRM